MQNNNDCNNCGEKCDSDSAGQNKVHLCVRVHASKSQLMHVCIKGKQIKVTLPGIFLAYKCVSWENIAHYESLKYFAAHGNNYICLTHLEKLVKST